MKPKAKKWIVIMLFLSAVGISYSLMNNHIPYVDAKNITDSSLIDYPSAFNYRQTINDCAPFNTAAVVRALTHEKIDSAVFADRIKWRLPNRYTLPWGLEKQLKENGINVEIANMKPLTDEERLNFLRERLSQKNPIIILGETKGYQHYMTIFGFNKTKNEFYAYDSLFEKKKEGFTKDTNGDLPGNRSFTSDELMDFWRGGGMYGFYKWYAIVASPDF